MIELQLQGPLSVSQESRYKFQGVLGCLQAVLGALQASCVGELAPFGGNTVKSARFVHFDLIRRLFRRWGVSNYAPAIGDGFPVVLTIVQPPCIVG